MSLQPELQAACHLPHRWLRETEVLEPGRKWATKLVEREACSSLDFSEVPSLFDTHTCHGTAWAFASSQIALHRHGKLPSEARLCPLPSAPQGTTAHICCCCWEASTNPLVSGFQKLTPIFFRWSLLLFAYRGTPQEDFLNLLEPM